MNNYYTAAEAIKLLNIPRSTFYHLIKIGEIPEGVVVPLRKQALYPKKDIDKLVEERARVLAEYEHTPERLKIMLPNREDLIQLVDIDRMVFHEETLILPEEQIARFAYNPEAIHVLKDTKTNTVLGGITLSPLKEDVLEKLIKLEIDETQVKPEDYQPFIPGKTQDCYVIGIIAKPGIAEKYYAGKLLYGALEYLIELLEQEIIVRRIYTVATTEDGDRLARSLHFQLLSDKWQGRHEDFRHSYILDLETIGSKSKLINRYLQQRKNLERRRKRYQREASRSQQAQDNAYIKTDSVHKRKPAKTVDAERQTSVEQNPPTRLTSHSTKL